METIIYILIALSILLYFNAISDMVRKRRNNPWVITVWMVIVFTVPVLGAIGYFLLGRNQLVSQKRFAPKFNQHL